MSQVAVAAGHPLAVEAALAVADRGGNVVDAVIAAQAVAAVAPPNPAGLGGDGLSPPHAPGPTAAVTGTGLSPAQWPDPDSERRAGDQRHRSGLGQRLVRTPPAPRHPAPWRRSSHPRWTCAVTERALFAKADWRRRTTSGESAR